ncbi:Hyaluronidase [Mesotoga infera]|uniref:Hyaluronidase n=1 Tax=Mesotoga infera TaxID=1236046 RepID=A0A7Z7LIH8_9BACT|nr:protein O-GlcNAcase [Mesotoga infera]SSC14073.1 Hyaluronidase [Mesotoga infera]
MKGFRIRGVVEGFYGKPWSMEDRFDIIQFMGDHGYNLYIYAPKDDELHRFRWRESYGDDFVKGFSMVVEKGRQCGVDVAMAISPGLTVEYSSEDDLQTFVGKLLSFTEMGVKSFALFYDDIPFRLSSQRDKERFKSLASAQVFFANSIFEALKRELPVFDFIICPTEYHGRAESEYIRELGEGLLPDIKIMWTGPQVCSQHIPESDAIKASGAFKREILYWDNYPVNDGSMIPELHIGPYVGRDPEIVNHSCGIVLNPMNQAHASMIVLGAAADFLNDPYGYDATISWVNAMRRLTPGLIDEMLLFGEYSLISPIHPDQSERPRKVIEEFRTLCSQGRLEEAIVWLEKEARTILESAKRLKDKLPSVFLEEMALWIYEFERWGEALSVTVEILKSRLKLYVETPEKRDLQQVRELIEKAETTMMELTRARTLSGGNVYREFIMEILIRTKGYFALKERNWL